jgi:hypothetical protein
VGKGEERVREKERRVRVHIYTYIHIYIEKEIHACVYIHIHIHREDSVRVCVHMRERERERERERKRESERERERKREGEKERVREKERERERERKRESEREREKEGGRGRGRGRGEDRGGESVHEEEDMRKWKRRPINTVLMYLLRSPAEPFQSDTFVLSSTIPCHHRLTQAVHCTCNSLHGTLLEPCRLQSPWANPSQRAMPWGLRRVPGRGRMGLGIKKINPEP